MDENSVQRQMPGGNSRSSTGCQNIGKVFLMIINIHLSYVTVKHVLQSHMIDEYL